MARQVFRQVALERLSSPEQLDRLMSLTSPREWIALAGAGIVLAAVVAWGVFGTIVRTVDAHGVLTRPGGVVAARAACTGAVDEILVRAGDTVEPGQELLRIRPAVDPSSEQPQSSAKGTSVVSPCAGTAFHVAVQPADLVAEGDILAAVESEDHPMAAVVYVAAAEGFRVTTGNRVRVTLGSGGDDTQTPLRGSVAAVGRFPVTRSVVMRTVLSEEWAASLAQQGPLVEVVVQLDAPRRQLVCGIPCQARIVVEERAPLALLLGRTAE